MIEVDVDRESIAKPLPFALGRAQKIMTRPPRYIFAINGRDVRLSFRDIVSPRRFAREVLAQTGELIPRLTRVQLDLLLIRACRRLEHRAAAPGGRRDR